MEPINFLLAALKAGQSLTVDLSGELTLAGRITEIQEHFFTVSCESGMMVDIPLHWVRGLEGNRVHCVARGDLRHFRAVR